MELKVPPPVVTVPQAFDLTTTWHCADWWNSWQSESDTAINMTVICPMWLLLISLIINDCVPLPILKIMFRIIRFLLLLFFSVLLCFSLWAKHDSHSSGFPCRTLLRTFWLAEAALGDWQPRALHGYLLTLSWSYFWTLSWSYTVTWCLCCVLFPVEGLKWPPTSFQLFMHSHEDQSSLTEHPRYP